MIELLLMLLLGFAPFAFGGVEPWGELIVIVLSGMLGTSVAMWLVLNSDLRAIRSRALVPMALFIALGTMQLLPLSAKFIAVVSPATVQTRTRFLADLPDAAELLKTFPISLYPHATRHDLRLVLAASAIFFAVVQYYRTPARVKRLLGWVAFVGAASALLAFAQDLAGTTEIFFVGPQLGRAVTAGPFVFYSDYCQFMNLSLGAMLALLLMVIQRKFGRQELRLLDLSTDWHNRKLRPMWLLAAIIILGVTTIFLSNGRGGMLATLIGFGLITLALSRNKGLPGQAWLILPLVLMIFGVLTFIGLDVVFDRLATLKQAETHGGRLEMLEDLTHVWRQYPIVGTGLGTHEVVYPRYDRSIIGAIATHAEDEYAQVIEETGFLGLGLVLWFVTIIWLNFYKTLRAGQTAGLVVTGLGYGLLAVMIHSFTDFGQHVPAIACLTAVVCGLMISVARLTALDKKQPESLTPASLPGLTRSSWLRSLPYCVVAILMTAVAAWAVQGAGKYFAAASEWKLAAARADRLSDKQWNGTVDEFRDLMTHATASLRQDPQDVEHRCFLNAYRWQQLEHTQANVTAPASTRTAQLREGSMQILLDLNTARRDCPVYGPAYRFIAQIESNVVGSPLSDQHSQMAFELGQTDSVACFFAALADVKAGRWKESESKFRRYLALGGTFNAVIDAYIRQANHPDLAIQLAQNDASLLNQLAGMFRSDPRHVKEAVEIDDRVFEMMKQQCSRKDATTGMLANCAQESLQHHDLPTAIEYYRRATELDFGQVDWHFALATSLKEANMVPEAMREARICLRLRPQMAAAEKLVGDLSLLKTPSTQAQNAK